MGERKRKFFDLSSEDRRVPESGPTPYVDEGPQSLGTMLRSARERQGIDLGDAARVLRIRRAFLQAIEDGRFKELPGATYATGFLRTYAEYLGLDPDTILRRFKEESSGAIARAELYLPKPVPEGRVPSGALVLIGVLLFAAIYGGWYYMSSTGRNLRDLVPPVPDRLAQFLNLKPAPATVVPVETVATTAAKPAAKSAEGQATASAAGDPATAPAIKAPATTASATIASATTGPATTGPATSASAEAPAAAARPAAQPAPNPTEMAANAAKPVTQKATDTAAARADAPAATTSSGAASSPTAAVAAQPATPPAGASAVAKAPAATASASEAQAEEQAPSPPTSVPPNTVPPNTASATQAPPPPATPPVKTASAAAPAAAPQAVPPSGKVYGATDGPARIVLHAIDLSWVEIRDQSGALVFGRLMKPGDVYRVPNQPGLKMTTGNAGGLEVSIDGGAGQLLGVPGKGQVKRDIVLDPQRLAAVH